MRREIMQSEVTTTSTLRDSDARRKWKCVNRQRVQRAPASLPVRTCMHTGELLLSEQLYLPSAPRKCSVLFPPTRPWAADKTHFNNVEFPISPPGTKAVSAQRRSSDKWQHVNSLYLWRDCSNTSLEMI